ncbi:MAG TPA: GH1 family beta-glucosidase [Puia sp.]
MPFNRSAFGEDFKWGVSTAAYQIEGAHDADAKGFSIWDEFTRKKKKIRGGHHGDMACDFYNLYPQDIRLLSELNIPNYRFSISWSRIFPQGTGSINQKGVDYYNRIIDMLLSRGIEPWVTLYHWDLPAALENKGGWTNRDILNWFSDFTACCVKQFGDRVKYWMILNEPMVFTGAGYFLGIHAPGKKGLNPFLAAVHHAALCQAEGGRIIKSLLGDSIVGTTFSYSPVGPWRDNDRDRAAVIKTDALLNRLFIEPLLGMGYPVKELKILQGLEKYYKDGDSKKIAFDMDFAGLQNYTREIVRHSFLMPFIGARPVKASKRNVEFTQMDWEVYPSSIFEAIMRWSQYKNLKEIIVTENGAAFEDHLNQGAVHDPRRLNYLENHIRQVLKARQAGARVNGYFVWTLLDNFEWAEGYTPKFGLVHVNFETQERIIKSSGKWYADFLGRDPSADIF